MINGDETFFTSGVMFFLNRNLIIIKRQRDILLGNLASIIKPVTKLNLLRLEHIFTSVVCY